MDLERITAWKNRIGLAGAALCCLFVISAIDGGVQYLRQPLNFLRLLPGESIKLTGPMAPGVRSIDGMEFETDSPAVSMSLEEVISGYWMGARMWRGRIDLSAHIVPGTYIVSVFGKEDRKRVGANTFQVTVYNDRASYLAGSKSLIMRYSGVSPWMAAGFFFSMVLLACMCLYLVSGKKDRLMAEQGEAEVFHVTRDETGISIYFGLGRLHGIERGLELQLLDSKRRPLGQVKVESVSDTNAMAEATRLSEVTTGCLVKRT
ncbi:MAG: hypothetical protein ABSG91_04830 [Syntrophobacteraceae bacterium]|jgi:hypothetical protein